MNKLTLIFLLAIVGGAFAENYAVLVAGSNGYGNYRHQSDVCHAYHTLLAKGFDKHNIIVLSYNDVASSKQNPFKGQLFNKPSYDQPGVDVNKGCVIDYQGVDVTPANYLAIIQGQKDKVKGGNKRVLESGPNDHVFLAFFDHGAPGLIAFPTDELYAKDLLNAFQHMYNNSMYARLVYYMEACESGSMFQDLSSTLNIYAVSAASPYESSWAAYCGQTAIVNSKNIGSCLGDLFSVNWLEDTDNHKDISDYSLQDQFVVVANLTTQSQVMQWGDVSYTSEAIGDYMSDKSTTTVLRKIRNYVKSFFKFGKSNNVLVNEPKVGLIESRKATFVYLLNKYTTNPTEENYLELNLSIEMSNLFKTLFENFSSNFQVSGEYHNVTTNFECYQNLVDEFQNTCGRIPEDQLGQLKYFYHYCQSETYKNLEVTSYFKSIC